MLSCNEVNGAKSKPTKVVTSRTSLPGLCPGLQVGGAWQLFPAAVWGTLGPRESGPWRVVSLWSGETLHKAHPGVLWLHRRVWVCDGRKS